jgi:TPP-dependent pyruvate/acetoin dehydrogenase alpha subunit
VIYVCENNMYTEYTRFSETTAGEILARPAAFGIEAKRVDGQDVMAVCQVTSTLVERARMGEGPAFLLCDTYRFYGHHVGDINRAYYRPKQEEQNWKAENDPILRLAERLEEHDPTAREKLEEIQQDVRAEIEQAAKFALDAPYPKPEEVDQDVYA